MLQRLQVAAWYRIFLDGTVVRPGLDDRLDWI
jgi:hypothetical protein